QDSLSVANRPSIHMTKRCTYYLNSRITPLCVAIAMVGLLGANTTTVAMEAAHGLSGVGSAFTGALQFGVAFACSAAVAACISESAFPLAMGMTIPAVIALLLWLFYSFSAEGDGLRE
ncbi:hypothetical protein, partial [Erwinia sp. V71]|uniref:hypothetical protein n=1 Tax=Erwinia sp. V71 TaxID=3369424 RepID=UPI003F5F2581